MSRIRENSPDKLFATAPTGAMRESIGTKTQTHLVPYELILCAAAGLNYGANKYTPRNFERGLSYLDLCMSIERHNRAIMDGEIYDSDSGLPHECLLASSVAMLCHNILQGVIVDDRAVPRDGFTISTLAKNMRQTEDTAEAARNGVPV